MTFPACRGERSTFRGLGRNPDWGSARAPLSPLPAGQRPASPLCSMCGCRVGQAERPASPLCSLCGCRVGQALNVLNPAPLLFVAPGNGCPCRPCRPPRQAYDLDFPPGLTVMGVDYDDLTNGEQDAPSIFSSAGLSAGAFLKSPYASHPAGSNASVPDIQVCVCAKRESESATSPLPSPRARVFIARATGFNSSTRGVSFVE